ncbi:MAG: ABC transporter substrate-binding protein [Actinobacteria bacterium]|nr:ABC transporter substrate-binding protein [Actinomycetota bacterium]
MRKTKRSLLIVLMAIALFAAACGDSSDDSSAGPSGEDSTTTAATVASEPADEPADEPEAPAASGEELIAGYADWDAVLAEADGQTVNFYLWGGSDKINADVDNDIGAQVSELFGVTLNRVPLGDTADAVNLVLNEIEAGQTTGGSVDMIWINGENFRTLKDADALLAAWSEALPNAVFVNWDDPSVANDFGQPVEGTESPWGHAQFVFEFNTELVGDVAPDSFEGLQTWIHENPGLFTYPAVPDFTGSVFLRHLFYWAAGGSEAFAGPFDQEVFDQYAPIVWEYLNDIEPSLWRGGDTYPTESAVQQDLLANQEVAFSMSYNPSNATTQINDGVYPDTIRTFIPVTGSVSNNNYVTIPSNASNAAGALVVANYMLSEEYQLKMTDPDGWGWLTATDPSRWSDEAQATLAGYEAGVATLPQDLLNANALPEPSADWVEAMEQGWLDNVL